MEAFPLWDCKSNTLFCFCKSKNIFLFKIILTIMIKMYAFIFPTIIFFTGSISKAACPPNKTSISETICKGDFYTTTNNSYNTTGIYFDTIKTTLGCDSIVEIKLLVYEVKTQGLVNESICEGDSIFWSGKFRKTPGDYLEKISNFYGCDSTTVLRLKINKRPTKDTTIQFCNGNSFSDDAYFLDKTGKYTLQYSTKSNCDSIVRLDLKINPTYSKTINVSICENTYNKIGSMTVSDEGIYYDSLKTKTFGCDSVFEYNVKMITPPAKPEINLQLPDSLFTAEQGSKYLWLVDKMKLTATTQGIKAPKNGSYRVVAYMEDKCPSDTSDIFVLNTVVTQIQNETIKEELSIFPNPASNHIIISGKNTLGKIQLLDNTGKIMSEYYTNQKQIELATSDLKAGKYILKLTGSNKKIQIVH
jgi:hypothetical protein